MVPKVPVKMIQPVKILQSVTVCCTPLQQWYFSHSVFFSALKLDLMRTE